MDKQDSAKVTIAATGRTVPVYFKDKNGVIIVPSEVERDIVLGFIGRAIASPVVGIVVVLGAGYREIRLTCGSWSEGIKNELQEIEVRGEAKRMNNVMRIFGSEIDDLENSNYPEEVKKMGKRTMLEAMSKRLKEVYQ